VTLSNEEKRQIMDQLAQGKPGLVNQEPPRNTQDDQVNAENYENFDDFAQRSVRDGILQDHTDGNLIEQVREQIKAELRQAKETGQLRSGRIREIVQAAISQVGTEIKAGSSDVRLIFRDTVSAVSESLQDKGSEIKEEVSAAVEGFIEGFSSGRRQSITKNQSEVKQLQAQIDTQEEELQQEIDRLIIDVEEAGNESSPKLKELIADSINTFKNSEEFALLKKRYAQLQAQAAILRANLAARYGGRYEEIKENLEEAKNWYSRTRSKTEAVVDQADQKGAHLDERLREAAEAIARKERQIRNILSELLKAAAELVREKDTPNK